MKQKILVTRIIPEEGLSLLREKYDMDLNEDDRVLTREELEARVKGKDALLSQLTDTIDRQFIENNSHLKVISNYAVGFNNIDIEAATEQGIFYEAISYASMCKLPVIFICENNHYSTYSPQWKRQPIDNVHKRVSTFGVKSQSLFGNDVAAVYLELSKAISYVRSGKGPFYIEAYTYRWRGHVGPEDDDYIGYRPQSEIDLWKKNCPIFYYME